MGTSNTTSNTTLYGVGLSPFVRKVMLALEHLEIDYQSTPTFPGDQSQDFRRISPLGKIPALDHDGFTVSDSSVICRYLSRLARGRLYPDDAQDEARACWLEEFADSKLVEACAGLFQERLLKPKMLNEPTDENRIQQIVEEQLPDLLRYLERVTPDSGYLVGDLLSVADISVVTCFIQARYGQYEVDGQAYPRLRAYLDRLLAEPLFVNRMASEQANMPPGL